MLERAKLHPTQPPAVGIAIEVRVAIGIEDHVERREDKAEAPEAEHGPYNVAPGLWAAQGDEPGKERVEEDIRGERPRGGIPEVAKSGRPALRKDQGESDAPGEFAVRTNAPLLRQNQDRHEQREEEDRIDAGEASHPEGAGGHEAAIGTLAVVVGEHEAGEQQKEADRDITIVDDRCEGTEDLRVREVKEEDVQGGKGAHAGERVQP